MDGDVTTADRWRAWIEAHKSDLHVSEIKDITAVSAYDIDTDTTTTKLVITIES